MEYFNMIYDYKIKMRGIAHENECNYYFNQRRYK